MDHSSNQKIAVLDFGGQYAHLIASRIRRLGAYSEIRSPSDLTAETARQEYSGLIYSGGPASVYDSGAPVSDPELLHAGLPILGICYGHQLIMHQAGADVARSENREYGPARLEIQSAEAIFHNEPVETHPVVWMSHGDEVHSLPEGFALLARTPDCRHAAVGHAGRRIYGLQFHPEVRESERGDFYLRNFINICGLENTWDLGDFLRIETDRIHEQIGNKRIFFLVSGGVDSTVAFAMLSGALPADHLRGLLIDTGFMRMDEALRVQEALRRVGVDILVHDASAQYFEKLKGCFDPEQKRRIIGELFVSVQAAVVEQLGLNADDWFLGQGTIYPDTIESGGTAHSHRIKTHHNRVEAIEELLARGRVVEPLRDLYKDEVRRLGSLLGLPDDLVHRHPFPGPGLAVRVLCSDRKPEFQSEDLEIKRRFEIDLHPEADATEADPDALLLKNQYELRSRLLPVESVGVQGDQRSYARCLALIPESFYEPKQIHIAHMRDRTDLKEIARRLPNRYARINRVIYCSGMRGNVLEFEPRFPVDLNPERTGVLREADELVHNFQMETGVYAEIWQFPVVLIPLGAGNGSGESIVLRPITSTDAMTAAVYDMRAELIADLTGRLLELAGIDAVFYDLTSKPPGTIEWE
ncbi:MAG: glutamine-hydrolyzing GMP synthase [Leptospiraceae bacterium]|nr:glutamine-hydrolyzing GMP synthase [Leptospiraceae bacterium]